MFLPIRIKKTGHVVRSTDTASHAFFKKNDRTETEKAYIRLVYRVRES